MRNASKSACGSLIASSVWAAANQVPLTRRSIYQPIRKGSVFRKAHQCEALTTAWWGTMKSEPSLPRVRWTLGATPSMSLLWRSHSRLMPRCVRLLPHTVFWRRSVISAPLRCAPMYVFFCAAAVTSSDASLQLYYLCEDSRSWWLHHTVIFGAVRLVRCGV